MKKLDEEKSFEIAKKFFKVPKQYFCINQKQAEKALSKLEFPVYLKAIGKKIIHKTERKAVVKVSNREKALKEFNRLKKLKDCEKVLIQEEIKGIELIVGIKHDNTFGKVLLLGIGGIFTEVLKDFSLRICPVEEDEINEMIDELKASKLLKDFRGIKINLEKLVKGLVKLSKFAEKSKIKEMDINPLICNEKACYAVDIRIFK